jgi:hypothetical protein
MSIQKKSLISTLKTAKKANVASSHDSEAKGSKISSTRVVAPRPGITMKSTKLNLRQGINMKSTKLNLRQGVNMKSAKVSAKSTVNLKAQQ